MKQLVRLRMRPSRNRKSFRYMLDYVDHDGRRRQISLGHAEKRQAERQRQEKELELRVNILGPVSMRLTDFFRDSLMRTKGQVRATTLSETARATKDFVECVGDIDVQEVRYEHGERFIQYCLDRELSAATVTKKVKHLKRVFQLAEDRGPASQTQAAQGPTAQDSRLHGPRVQQVVQSRPAVRRERLPDQMGASHSYVPEYWHAA
jgi:hypothetical protein